MCHEEYTAELLNTAARDLDADIYVRPSAPDLFEAAGDADFAGVLESELPLGQCREGEAEPEAAVALEAALVADVAAAEALPAALLSLVAALPAETLDAVA